MNTRSHFSFGRCVAMFVAMNCVLFSLGVSVGAADPAASPASYRPAIDPAGFLAVVNHPYFTLTPGKTFVYKKGDEINKVTVTDRTKKVMGVTTRVVWDRVWVNGQLTGETYDWYAQDRAGNVWYFSENTKEYKKGKAASSHGSWEAGVGGAQPGIAMPVEPKPGEPYRQEYRKGEAEDMGQVLSVSERIKVPAGNFTDCVKTKDWSAIEPNSVEHKYYSKKIGNVVLETEGGDRQRVELIGVTTAPQSNTPDTN